MISSKNLRLRIATEKDSKKILEHIRTVFYQEEPLCRVLQLDDLTSTECSVACISQNVSVVAEDEFSNIAAICVNCIKQKTDSTVDLECNNTKLMKIFKLLHYVDSEAGVFERYPIIDKIMCINILSVSPMWRRKGLAKILIEETKNIATNLGVPLIRIDCTSYYSGELAQKNGFRCIYRKKYEDYLQDGVPVFTPDLPHDEVAIYTLELYPKLY